MPRPDDDDRADDDDADDDRITRTLAAIAVVLFLALAGLWLVQKLNALSNEQDCLMQGRTNCAPVSGQ